MKMNKFIKYPLILGVVGAICAGALGLVYEITNPIITERANAASTAALKELVDIDNAEDITATLNADDAKQYKINTVYKATKSGDVVAYGYQATGTGYGGDMVMLVVLSAKESKILGYKTISHNETNSGTYGGPLLNSSDFAAQFNGLAFDKVDTDLDYKAGSTAKVTMGGVKTAVNNVITFHQKDVLGEEVSTIQLTAGEEDKLNLAAGSKLVDKTEDFKTALGANATQAIKDMWLLNYVDIVDSASATTGHAYICKVDISDSGHAGNQSTKFVLSFDKDWANSKMTIVSSGETIGDSEDYVEGPDYDANSFALATNKWINNFNGKAMSEFVATKDTNLNIDAVYGGTITTSEIIKTVAAVANYHAQANA